jgi:outer membrane protein assembly factor BamB
MIGRVAVGLALIIFSISAEDWPQFRGPRQDGTSRDQAGLHWKLLWKSQLPGPGHSSPIVWGDLVVVTAFEPETSVMRRLMGREGRLLVAALERNTGRLVWQQEVATAAIEKTTSINKPATPTPATDGRRIFTYFGSFGLASFLMNGTPDWHLRIGRYPHHMGSASSPVVSGNVVLLNVETDGPSFLYSIERSSGRVLWQVPRRTRQAGYATPVVWNGMVVIAGSQSVTAYNFETGNTLWDITELSTYVVPTPVIGDGLLYATASGPGGNVVAAVRQTGDVVWRSSRGAAYVASPVYFGGRLCTVNNNCVVSCLDGRNGALLWQQRISSHSACYASPIAVSDQLIIISESGELFVLDAKTSFRLRVQEQLHERILASPAISNGMLFVRSDKSLTAFAIRAPTLDNPPTK